MFEPKTEYINNDIAARGRNLEFLQEISLKEKGINKIINPWIGIHHLYDEGRTVYASDMSTVELSNWDPVDPWDATEPNNNNGGEDCVHLYNEGLLFFKWNDNNCNEYRRFICEKGG